MSFDSDPESPFDQALRPGDTAASDAGEVRFLVLLPSLEVLLDAPEFGRHSPIALPGSPPPIDGWAQFGSVRARGFTVH
jgi:hypothetical protein